MKWRSYYLGELAWLDVKEFLAVHDLAVDTVGLIPDSIERFIKTSYDAHAGEFETSTTLASRKNFVVK